MRKQLFGFTGIAVATLVFFPFHASAQDDPPSRVARVSYIRGYVSFQPAGTGDWIDASVNRTLTTGDELWSDTSSRVGLHIGSASINLSEKTGFTFLNLSDNTIQIQLSSGSIRLRVKRMDDSENFEIDTPNLAFSILRPGIYRVTVNDSGDTTVIEDRRGEGEVTGGGSAFTVHAGDLGSFYGTDNLSADVEDLGSNADDFETWCQQRDHHEDVSVSARYVSDDAIGYDDLDDNGGWRPVPQYGMVWFPRAAQPDWAPYHYGHWEYVAPWGYTWVDDAAWGFAPFHYGRWVNVGGSWGWIPCPPRPPQPTVEYVRPVYAPALVAWVGGPHFSIGVSIGAAAVGVAWFPLGPREVYVPSYPVSRNYVTNVNVSNTTVNKTVVNNYYTTVVVNKTVNVTNVTYVNQRVPGAVVATSSQAFSSGQPVARNVVHVDPREVAAAPVAAMTPPAVPQRAAVLGGHVAARVQPPAAVLTRTVVVKTNPPPPPPTFAKRQAAIQSNGGHPISVAQARQLAPVRAQMAAAPRIKVAPVAKAVAPPRGNAAHPNGPKPQPAAATNAINKPGTPPAAAPGKPAPTVASKPANPPATNPPTANPHPPAPPVDPRLAQQQQANLRAQQDQERLKLQKQQQQEVELLHKQKADADKVKLVQQHHQQQQQALAQKHQQEQAQLQKRQEDQRRLQQEAKGKPKPKDEKEPK